MNDYGLPKDLHDNMFIALKLFDKLCRSNDICYSLFAGTLLGAVRSGDFIPWDDDLDILLSRNDFNKLQLISDQCICGFSFKKNNWVSVIEFDIHGKKVGLDLFILDKTSFGLFHYIRIFLLRFVQVLIKGNNVNPNLHFINKLIQGFVNLINPLSKNKLLKFYDFISLLKMSDSEVFYVSNDNFNAIGYKYDFIENFDVDFMYIKDAEFPVFKCYHEILSQLYGEKYLIPPPLNERIPKHL